jgi:serine/threonine-protein kinase
VIAGVLVLLAVVAAGAFIFLSGGQAKTVVVPPVAGLDSAAAQRALTDAGLEPQVSTVTSATVEKGQAIETDPPAGEEVDEGSTVILRVSGGPGDATVPDVANQTEEAATIALKREDFDVATSEEASDTVAEGLVIRTDPPALSRAERGSTVTLILSTGAEDVAVPNVTRLDRATAEQTLTNRGFRVKVANRPTTAFAAGIVIEQDPLNGTKAPKGSFVTITVAVAPSNVTVESVIGLSADDARSVLEGQGLRVTSDTADSNDPAGTVIDQEPGGGAGVAPGSRIIITVSNGPVATTTSVPAPPPTTTP